MLDFLVDGFRESSSKTELVVIALFFGSDDEATDAKFVVMELSCTETEGVDIAIRGSFTAGRLFVGGAFVDDFGG